MWMELSEEKDSLEHSAALHGSSEVGQSDVLGTLDVHFHCNLKAISSLVLLGKTKI